MPWRVVRFIWCRCWFPGGLLLCLSLAPLPWFSLARRRRRPCCRPCQPQVDRRRRVSPSLSRRPRVWRRFRLPGCHARASVPTSRAWSLLARRWLVQHPPFEHPCAGLSCPLVRAGTCPDTQRAAPCCPDTQALCSLVPVAQTRPLETDGGPCAHHARPGSLARPDTPPRD